MKKIVIVSAIMSVLCSTSVLGQTLYPTSVDITKFEEKDAIIKTYEVEKDEEFKSIQDNINFDSEDYVYFDTFKNSVNSLETKSHNHKIEMKKQSDFPATFLYEDINGWKGTLTLNKDSITPINVRYSTYTSTLTRNRTYPNLYSNDLSVIPKSIVENGTTYNFSSVNWVDDSVFDVDSQSETQRYTANVTYSTDTIGKKSSADSYYAIYSGEITREVANADEYKVVYIKSLNNVTTDIDTSTDIVDDSTENTDSKSGFILQNLSNILLLLLIILMIIYFLGKIKKEKPNKNTQEDILPKEKNNKPLFVREKQYFDKIKKLNKSKSFVHDYKNDEQESVYDEEYETDSEDDFNLENILNTDEIDEDIY